MDKKMQVMATTVSAVPMEVEEVLAIPEEDVIDLEVDEKELMKEAEEEAEA